MANTSPKSDDTNVSEVSVIPSTKSSSKRVPDASEAISQPEIEEIAAAPTESKNEKSEDENESVPEPDQTRDMKILQPQAEIPAGSSPKPTKSGKRTREEYEELDPDAEEAIEERLPPLPIPKRTQTSKSVIRAKEPLHEASDISTDSISAEEVPLPSSASDTSETPSTAFNEDIEPSPKIPAESSDDDHLLQRVSKRRRITDTFKGLFNVFGDSVSSALSFALDRST